jgi:hypothetical protein
MRLWLLRESCETGELIDARDADRCFLVVTGFGFSGVCLVRLDVRGALASKSLFTRLDALMDFVGVEGSELRRVTSGVFGAGSVSAAGDGEEIDEVTADSDMKFSFVHSSFIGPPLLADGKSTQGKIGLRSSGDQLISKAVCCAFAGLLRYESSGVCSNRLP